MRVGGDAMRERLRVLLAMFFYYSGAIRLALWLRGRVNRQLLILNYHRANGNLPQHLWYLQRHYHILHLDEALQELYAPYPNQLWSHRRMPLVVTFDDGYLDNYTEAFRLAQHYQMPITIFLIPGYVESGRYFWWLAAEQLVTQLQRDGVTLEGKSYQLTESKERQALIQMIDSRARNATSVAERETFLATVEQTLAVSLPCRNASSRGSAEVPQAMVDASLSLTWEQIREMEATGLISFGAHTVHHPILAYLTNPAELAYEVEQSRFLLEEKLGHSIRSFAYPVGKFRHIGEQGVAAVKAAGYTWAVTTLEEHATSQSNPLLLGRLPGDVDVHWMVLAAELVGLLGIVSRIREKYARVFKK